MSELIIIRGPLGVGKTTIANELAKKLSAVNFSVDGALEKIGYKNIEGAGISIEDFIRVNNSMLPQIKQALEQSKPVIIDGCFYHKEQIEHLKENISASISVFTLKASIDTCIRRDKHREKSYGEDAAQAVHGMVSKFDEGTVVDTENMTTGEVVDKILSYLPGSNK